VHWIGGDPEKGEVYGYASWNSRKGIFSLRNPSGTKKTFEVNLKKIFELPSTEPGSFKLKNIFSSEQQQAGKLVLPDQTILITLAPYELKIWEALPGKI
jgi:hypothetical protein